MTYILHWWCGVVVVAGRARAPAKINHVGWRRRKSGELMEYKPVFQCRSVNYRNEFEENTARRKQFFLEGSLNCWLGRLIVCPISKYWQIEKYNWFHYHLEPYLLSLLRPNSPSKARFLTGRSRTRIYYAIFTRTWRIFMTRPKS